jgi:tetratricopeptide (TPR) repeat protein
MLAPTNSTLHFQLANLALRQNDAAESERAYRAMLAARPDDAVALAGLAAVALTRGNCDEARDWLERARLAGAPASTLAIPSAALLSASGRTEEALDALRALTDSQAGHLEAWSLLADLLLRQNNTAEVEKRVLPAMVKAAGTGDHVLIHLVRAALLRARQPFDPVAVQTSLLCALKLRPDLVAIHGELLQLDFDFGSMADRERDALAVLRVVPEHAFANYLLGTVLLARGELSRAEDLFRRSLAARPTPLAHNDLAETLRGLGKLPEAEKSARAALALDGQSYAAWDTLGCVLLDAGRVDEAEQAVARALELCATNPYMHVSLARVRLAQGRWADLREILARPVLKTGKLPPELQREIDALAAQLPARAQK